MKTDGHRFPHGQKEKIGGGEMGGGGTRLEGKANNNRKRGREKPRGEIQMEEKNTGILRERLSLLN